MSHSESRLSAPNRAAPGVSETGSVRRCKGCCRVSKAGRREESEAANTAGVAQDVEPVENVCLHGIDRRTLVSYTFVSRFFCTVVAVDRLTCSRREDPPVRRSASQQRPPAHTRCSACPPHHTSSARGRKQGSNVETRRERRIEGKSKRPW